jgi:hypothetical protein
MRSHIRCLRSAAQASIESIRFDGRFEKTPDGRMQISVYEVDHRFGGRRERGRSWYYPQSARYCSRMSRRRGNDSHAAGAPIGRLSVEWFDAPLCQPDSVIYATAGMADIIICPLLNANDKRGQRHYVRLYPRKCCSVCRAEVAVTKDIWCRVRAGEDLTFICEQCSVLQTSD